MVRLYCFLRLNLNTITLSPRPCSEIVPFTRAPASAAPAVTSFESFTTASTRSNSTSEPTSPGSVSTRTTSPGATRYCFPPVSITAYITILLDYWKCGSSGRLIQANHLEPQSFMIQQVAPSAQTRGLQDLRAQSGWYPDSKVT